MSISQKIKEVFPEVTILKDPELKDSVFSGRNLPSFVKDFLVRKHINEEGILDKVRYSTLDFQTLVAEKVKPEFCLIY